MTNPSPACAQIPYRSETSLPLAPGELAGLRPPGLVSQARAASAEDTAGRLDSVFRATVGHFASGVVIVTGTAAGVPTGLTCQSFFSLSLDPPLIAIAVGKSSASWPAIAASGAFCVNVLPEDQAELCRAFSRSGTDKFAGVAWTPAPTGSPRLDNALAWIDCRIEAIHPAGDHHLVIGSVADLAAGDGNPLLYFRGRFSTLGPA
jgi:3-hydroxy-9,10-secoandrosta-1,3,5(10)-triene-9,17-dione monooxygenase reductase component